MALYFFQEKVTSISTIHGRLLFMLTGWLRAVWLWSHAPKAIVLRWTIWLAVVLLYRALKVVLNAEGFLPSVCISPLILILTCAPSRSSDVHSSNGSLGTLPPHWLRKQQEPLAATTVTHSQKTSEERRGRSAPALMPPLQAFLKFLLF